MNKTNDSTHRKAEAQVRLEEAVCLTAEKVRHAHLGDTLGGSEEAPPVLVLLAAGRGSRFGKSPKCIQPVCNRPLARHSVDSFRRVSDGPAVCMVHYREDEIMQALGDDLIYIHSDNPTGGTAFAAFEALSLAAMEENNALMIISMGDRIVPSTIFQKIMETHNAGHREADLTLLSAIYDPQRVKGKGRIVRNESRKVLRLVEQRDIDAMQDRAARAALDAITEANCPLYAIRAETLRRFARNLLNDNAQEQYYFTDIVEAIVKQGGDVRTVTTKKHDMEYDLLCSDVTRPRDLALLEGVLASTATPETQGRDEVNAAVAALLEGRPAGQVTSIIAQLEELWDTNNKENLSFEKGRPIGVGVSGGRLRIAFMHPDMGRFFGPAWQMPIGAADAKGREQIVVLIQGAEDGKIHLFPTDPKFRERLNTVAGDDDSMYPDEEIDDWYSFEGFGTRMAERLLLSLGYFSDEEIETRRQNDLPLPPEALWLRNSLRRPFSLVGNSIASIRTLREGALGERVQTYLGKEGFQGLKVMSTGNIPQGGFSSSSAMTVAMKNALNSLYNLGIGPDLLVHLACQAEYGTGVRAGSLDQATAQKGRAGQGVLLSSNPRENFREIQTFAVPTERFKVLFPYSVDRDRQAGVWSAGAYATGSDQMEPTPPEMRKLTGKSAELAAILTRLPLDSDFFPPLEEELLHQGELSPQTRSKVYDLLKQLPLNISRDGLRAELAKHRQWYTEALMAESRLQADDATQYTDALFESLLAGWREPLLRRGLPDGRVVAESGVPLRAMVAYLFGEVAKNFYLMHHPESWIEMVTRSQGGDRSFEIAPQRLPDIQEMLTTLPWEAEVTGPKRLEAWLNYADAAPVDFNRDLDDESLSQASPKPLRFLRGGNFFRGLALIDLVEAMLKRAFGEENIAVRVNAAGQGDFFQVHLDTERVDVDAVKDFLRKAYYQRFGILPESEFVELHPGGGAVGLRLSRFDALPKLFEGLRAAVADTE